MLVLNLLNRIFGKKPSLKRSDIDGYQENTDQQKIEEQASSDDFDSDALEGFSESSLNTDAMHSLDEKIKATYGSGGTNWGRVIALSSVIAACVVIAFVLFNPSDFKEQELAMYSKKDLQIAEEKVQLDSVSKLSDKNVLKESIESENDAEKKMEENIQETSPERIKRSHPPVHNDETEVPVIQDQTTEVSRAETENMRMLDFEPTSSIPHNNSNNESLNYGQAKEFYMLDFKLVDYRAYREQPIKETRFEVSGTPAYMENDSDDREDAMFEEKEIEITYVDYLKESLNYFQNEKYKKALQHFNTILEHYEDDVNANFYAGLSAYNLESYSQAEAYFKKAYSLQYGNFKEEANWFEALSLLKLNKKSKAKKLLQQIVAGNGFYAERAKEKLTEI